MRRIYESEALRRDNENPHVPNESDGDDYRSVNWRNASHALVPKLLRPRALSVSVETTKERYEVGEPVRFRVTYRNKFPMPISLQTTSPVPWTWEINGIEHASHVEEPVPEKSGLFHFERSQRKQFTRRWTQRFRESNSEWSVAEPGEYTLTIRTNASSGADRLTAETTFYIE